MSLISLLLLLSPTAALGTVGAAPVVAVAGTSGLAVDAPVAAAIGEVAPGSARVFFAIPDVGVVWLFPAGFEYGTMLFVATTPSPFSNETYVW
jgi:hypothetical protein